MDMMIILKPQKLPMYCSPSRAFLCLTTFLALQNSIWKYWTWKSSIGQDQLCVFWARPTWYSVAQAQWGKTFPFSQNYKLFSDSCTQVHISF